MRRYVVSRAERHGLEVRRDEAGNVVVVKPATPGREAAPTTVLQSHLDMVQEKNSDVAFDFGKRRDPSAPRRRLPDRRRHHPGLGQRHRRRRSCWPDRRRAVVVAGRPRPRPARAAVHDRRGDRPDRRRRARRRRLVTGRRLLNLDTEEEGSVYVGCAGGADSASRLPLARGPLPAAGALTVRVSGLKGGHSGVDIHLSAATPCRSSPGRCGRPTSGRRCASPASPAARPQRDPARGDGAVVVGAGEEESVRQALAAAGVAITAELAPVDPGFSLSVESGGDAAEAWDEATSARALALLVALPHGVLAMSQEIPDLVETSNNVAVVGEEEGVLTVLTSTRSSVASALDAVRRRLTAIGRLAGAEVELHSGYPGWQPDLDSALLATVRSVHQRVLGREPQIKAIHAGLETGILGEKLPGIDMVSIGPQIEFPHSPDERVHIPSVGRFWQLLAATLAELA
jgi:dipeptidase D